jgi:2-polyprenyl-3-methyl-5-hydroxy-6-metoxy-1,4-benzoquinol methylase
MPSNKENSLDSDTVLDAFLGVKERTDEFIVKNKLQTYYAEFVPRSDELAIAIFCNAFEELGCFIRSASPGTKLEHIKHVPAHKKLVKYIYEVLEKKAGLIEISGAEITRTSVACPSNNIDKTMKDLLHDRPAQDAEVKLMQITGPSLAKCLSGKTDGIQLIFGAPEGRTLLDKLYATSNASSTALQQLEAFIEEIGVTWPTDAGPLRILEIGAGTGGTTSRLLPALARLDIPVVYTMTDLSSALVTEAASTFKQYPFVKFEVVDIEQEPSPSLRNSQHIVLGSNVIHATRDLSVSLEMIHKMLRPDGFLIFHELTTQMLWADSIFGLFEGWWRFEDGRQHALQSAKSWATVLKSAGYSNVDWTDGRRPEARLQKLIFAMASDSGSMFG